MYSILGAINNLSPVRDSASPLNLGKPSKAICSLAASPFIRTFFTLRTVSVSKLTGPTNFSNVVFGSELETTIPAFNSRPSLRITPVTLSTSMLIRSTTALSSISTPSAFTAFAIDWPSWPIPPLTNETPGRPYPKMSPMCR